MGWKIDFDDMLNKHSMRVRRTIKEMAEIILTEPNITLRGIEREMGIPRRTLKRYILEYTKALEDSWPESFPNGDEILWDEIRGCLLKTIQRNVVKYQRAGGQGYWTG